MGTKLSLLPDEYFLARQTLSRHLDQGLPSDPVYRAQSYSPITSTEALSWTAAGSLVGVYEAAADDDAAMMAMMAMIMQHDATARFIADRELLLSSMLYALPGAPPGWLQLLFITVCTVHTVHRALSMPQGSAVDIHLLQVLSPVVCCAVGLSS